MNLWPAEQAGTTYFETKFLKNNLWRQKAQLANIRRSEQVDRTGRLACLIKGLLKSRPESTRKVMPAV